MISGGLTAGLSVLTPGAIGPGAIVAPPLPVSLTGALPQATRGTSYSAPLSIVGGTGPFTATLSGAPAGLGVTVSGRTLTLAWSNPQ